MSKKKNFMGKYYANKLAYPSLTCMENSIIITYNYNSYGILLSEYNYAYIFIGQINANIIL